MSNEGRRQPTPGVYEHTPAPPENVRASIAGKITPDMLRDTAGWSQSEDDLRDTLRLAADELERALAAAPAHQTRKR